MNRIDYYPSSLCLIGPFSGIALVVVGLWCVTFSVWQTTLFASISIASGIHLFIKDWRVWTRRNEPAITLMPKHLSVSIGSVTHRVPYECIRNISWNPGRHGVFHVTAELTEGITIIALDRLFLSEHPTKIIKEIQARVPMQPKNSTELGSTYAYSHESK